ncbi:hypothetical protein CALCODRAFT_495660 [Calocera cornea HHB12733]|uniref:Uncharacterized protein n=1 Tax=Calocera cornea HHB12733 TaxID=1353952 RepID=A0A165GAU5_9BASI|nr:hypothetical protein CALCODRAFT_495660 [Calocera cornea HHB12733]
MPYPGYVYQGYWLPHPGAITPFTPRRSNQPPAYSADTPPRQPVAPHGQQPHSYMPWIQPVHHMFPATPPGGHEQYLRPRQGRSNVPGSTTHPVDLPASFVQSQAGLIPVWGEHVINQYFAENPQVFDPRRGVFGGQVAQGPLGIAMPQTPQSATPNRGMFDPNGMAQPKRFAQHERTDTNQSFTSTSSFNSGTHAPSDGSPPRMPGGPPPAYGMHPVYAYGYSYPPPPVPYVSQRPSMPGDAQAYLQFHEGGR